MRVQRLTAFPVTDKIYSRAICLAALRGEKLPTTDISAMSYVVRLCVLRGIRHTPGFATELRSVTSDLAFTRALNARAIMSDQIPDMLVDEIPYCIWSPDVASVDTYRELARRYPQMRYQVGRACAVAGYSRLYEDLNLLPDISIAEEARDSIIRSRQPGSIEIFQHIIRQPIRYRVLDDYTRSVDIENPPPAEYGLNGDTAVVSTLELKRSFLLCRPESISSVYHPNPLNPPHAIDNELAPRYFNITEDWNIDEFTSIGDASIGSGRQTKRPMSEEMLDLLWTPLPRDLPWGDKDILILMAAYYGDIDRYVRLRRPRYRVSCAERGCIQRGIHHSTAFAKWWSLQPNNGAFISSINARFIMVNDLSRISAETPDEDLPEQIWYPLRAQAETYMELARRKPTMNGAVARALVVADYQEAWDSLDFEPYEELMEEAKASTNPHYLRTLQSKCAEQGLRSLENRYPPDLRLPISAITERTATTLVALPRVDSIAWDTQGSAIYNGSCADVSEIELYIAAPKELRPPAGFDELDVRQFYLNPPSARSKAYRKRGQIPRRGLSS